MVSISTHGYQAIAPHDPLSNSNCHPLPNFKASLPAREYERKIESLTTKDQAFIDQLNSLDCESLTSNTSKQSHGVLIMRRLIQNHNTDGRLVGSTVVREIILDIYDYVMRGDFQILDRNTYGNFNLDNYRTVSLEAGTGTRGRLVPYIHLIVALSAEKVLTPHLLQLLTPCIAMYPILLELSRDHKADNSAWTAIATDNLNAFLEYVSNANNDEIQLILESEFSRSHDAAREVNNFLYIIRYNMQNKAKEIMGIICNRMIAGTITHNSINLIYTPGFEDSILRLLSTQWFTLNIEEDDLYSGNSDSFFWSLYHIAGLNKNDVREYWDILRLRGLRAYSFTRKIYLFIDESLIDFDMVQDDLDVMEYKAEKILEKVKSISELSEEEVAFLYMVASFNFNFACHLIKYAYKGNIDILKIALETIHGSSARELFNFECPNSDTGDFSGLYFDMIKYAGLLVSLEPKKEGIVKDNTYERMISSIFEYSLTGCMIAKSKYELHDSKGQVSNAGKALIAFIKTAGMILEDQTLKIYLPIDEIFEYSYKDSTFGGSNKPSLNDSKMRIIEMAKTL